MKYFKTNKFIFLNKRYYRTVQLENEQNRWKINNNLENERIQIVYCTTEEKPNVVNEWWMNLVMNQEWTLLTNEEWTFLMNDEWKLLTNDEWTLLTNDEWTFLTYDEWTLLTNDEWTNKKAKCPNHFSRLRLVLLSWFYHSTGAQPRFCSWIYSPWRSKICSG